VLVDLEARDPLLQLIRLVVEPASARLRHPIEVVPMPGEDNIVATRGLLAAPADGSTIFLAPSSLLSSGPFVRGGTLPFNPRQAFAPIGRLGHFPLVAIMPAEGRYRDQPALLAAERASPGTVRLGTAGNGTAGHIQLARVMAEQGMSRVMEGARHFDDFGSLIRAVIAGEVDLAYVYVPGALPALRAGQLRVLYVTSRDRVVWVPQMEAVPSLTEVLPGWTTDFMPWVGFVARAGTPAEALSPISAALAHVLDTDAVRTPLLAASILPNPDPSPEDFARFWDADIAVQRDFARAAGFRG
jgi:tripartite-type tricarboxylate transporter receptor subunit TctC